LTRPKRRRSVGTEAGGGGETDGGKKEEIYRKHRSRRILVSSGRPAVGSYSVFETPKVQVERKEHRGEGGTEDRGREEENHVTKEPTHGFKLTSSARNSVGRGGKAINTTNFRLEIRRAHSSKNEVQGGLVSGGRKLPDMAP